MNVLINFRYIAGYYDKQYIKKVLVDLNNSNVFTTMIDSIKKFTIKLKDIDDLSASQIIANQNIIYKINKSLEKLINLYVLDFNKYTNSLSYLWLDEICMVMVDKGKLIPLDVDDISEYSDSNDIKKCVEKALSNLIKKDESIDAKTFHSTVIVIYIDIIEKNNPIIYYQFKK